MVERPGALIGRDANAAFLHRDAPPRRAEDNAKARMARRTVEHLLGRRRLQSEKAPHEAPSPRVVELAEGAEEAGKIGPGEGLGDFGNSLAAGE